jgi:hypothetical protein
VTQPDASTASSTEPSRIRRGDVGRITAAQPHRGLAAAQNGPVPSVTAQPGQGSGQRVLVHSLLFIALVAAAVGSLGAPLINSVATTSGVSLAAAQWTLTITLLSGAVATPVLGRLGGGPRRRETVIGTLAVPFLGATDVARRPYTTVLTSHVSDALSKTGDS